jgi:uncharacterized membrane protein
VSTALRAPAIVSSTGTGLFSQVAPWLALFIGVVLLGAIIMVMLRRRMQREQAHDGIGFTLHELRQLHASGELSDAEFARARQAMIDAVKAPAEPADEAGPSSPGGP